MDFSSVTLSQYLLARLSLASAYFINVLPFHHRLIRLERGLQNILSYSDVPQNLVDEFQKIRNTPEYLSAFSIVNPLVSVCIATYNRGNLLTERAVTSVLEQTYSNIEVLVIGDHCTDDTAERLARIGDTRLKFINLPHRGSYSKVPEWQWMVAGTTPVNHALAIAQGVFITHLDDDDEYAPARIQKLLSLAQQSRADVIWHPFWIESKPKRWRLKAALDFRMGQITTSSVFYHHWFSRIPWDIQAWQTREPGDWNRFRKFDYIGAKFIRHPDVLLKHYCERTSLMGSI